MKSLFLLFSLFYLANSILGIGRKQSVAVQGRLLCQGKPAAGVKVKLYEKEVIKDVKMDEGKTNANGEFYLTGSKSEITTIDPKVNIYHRCNYVGLCYRKFGITIPDSYVSLGNTPQKVYDIGTINLMNRFNGETTDCIN